MARVTETDISISIVSLRRHEELTRTLRSLAGLANVGVILNGADPSVYAPIIDEFAATVRFTINEKNLGVAAAFNQGIVMSDTRYVVLSGDDLIYPDGWIDPLLSTLNAAEPPEQVSLSSNVAFSSFCVDKRLIARQGWFDHNFTRIYYEDDDWCLRVLERTGDATEPSSAQHVIPRLDSVIRNDHARAPWNSIPNRVYFWKKWERVEEDGPGVMFLRPWLKVRRRRPEPLWPYLETVRDSYRTAEYGARPFVYDKPPMWIRALTRTTTNRALIAFRSAWRRRRNPEGMLK